MDSNRIYVAGRFLDENIPKYIQLLQDKGFVITHDWTKCEETASRRALFDINGVKACDIFIAIMDDKSYPYRGTFCEIGCALGLNIRIIIVNPNDDAYCTETCFYDHPSIIHVKTFANALEII